MEDAVDLGSLSMHRFVASLGQRLKPRPFNARYGSAEAEP